MSEKHLGVPTKKLPNYWTDEEDQTIIREFENGLMYKDMIYFLPRRSAWSIRDRALFLGLSKKNNVNLNRSSKSHPKYKVNSEFFSKPNTLNSYIAGFIAADGYIYEKKKAVSIHLNRRDEGHLLMIKEKLSYSGVIRYCKTDESATLCISGVPRLLGDLKNSFNVIPRKTNILEPPELSLSNSLPFIIGYIDGDGSLGLYGKTQSPFLSIVGTYNMLIWIRDIFNQIGNVGIDNKVGQAGKSKASIYTLTGRKAQKIIQILYNIPHIPKLDRKWNPEKIFPILERKFRNG
jgi:intein/homing endonuclease